MKKPSTKRVIVAILILFVAYSGFATYNWLEGERTDNHILNDAIHLSDVPLLELSDMGLVAESLIEPDVTDELLTETITRYLFHARTLTYSSSMLYTLTNDEEYRLFAAAMSDLRAFFIEVHNRLNNKEILMRDLHALKQIGDILEETLPIDNLTLGDARKFLDLSGDLTIG